MNSEHLWLVILVSPILLTQGILLFLDAKKKGAYAWVWGILGLVQFPMPAIFYYLIVIRPYRKRLGREEK